MPLTVRSISTASGRANCSPMKPETKRPPRISPRASSLLRICVSSRHLGAIGSRASKSGNRTPYRRSSCRALASTASVTGLGGSSSDHRLYPPRLWDPADLAREDRRPWSEFPLMRCRRVAMPSEVTRPAAASSHSASSTSEGRRPVAAWSSDGKDAPRLWRSSSTSPAPPVTSSSASTRSSSSQSRDSRRARVMGVTLDRGERVGEAWPLSLWRVRRPQITSPPKHSPSSIEGA